MLSRTRPQPPSDSTGTFTQDARGLDSYGRRVRHLRWAAISTAAVTYLLVILGSTVRVTESGMGCRGWPLCDGALGPRVDHFHSIMEQSHRYVVVLVTVGVIVTALAAWRLRERAPAVVAPALVGAGVIVVQIVLGAITVWTHNAPVTVALHLLVAMVFLAIAVATAVASVVMRKRDAPPRSRRLGWLGWSAVLATFVLMISGSMVVDGGAARACPSWPLCTSGHAALPLVAIQLSHRAIVGLASIAIVAFSVQVFRRWTDQPRAVRGIAIAVVVVLVVQAGVGALDAVMKAPAALQDLHLAFAAAIWAGVVCLASIGWFHAAAASPPAGDGGCSAAGSAASLEARLPAPSAGGSVIS